MQLLSVGAASLAREIAWSGQEPFCAQTLVVAHPVSSEKNLELKEAGKAVESLQTW